VVLKSVFSFRSKQQADCHQQPAMISAKMVSSMPTPSLKEFAQAIPVCELTAGLAVVRELFCTSGCDTIVVVSQQQRPLGVINLRQILPYLSQTSENLSLTIQAGKREQPFQLAQIIEPLVILPAQLQLSDFWAYLQQLKAPNHQKFNDFTLNQHWVLVDEQEKLVGLLDSWQILNFCASNFQETNKTVTQTNSQNFQLAPLLQLLEQIPLPLSLQTATGEILAQNLAWQTQIDTDANDSKPNAHSQDSLLNSLNSSVVESEFSRSAHNLKAISQEALFPDLTELQFSKLPLHHTRQEELGEKRLNVCNRTNLPLTIANTTDVPFQNSKREANQQHCALDTPPKLTEVSQRRVMLSTLLALESEDEAAASEKSRQNPQPKSFSFIKIPLLPSRSKLDQTWGHSINASASNNTADILLVLAQDTTEQEQVAKELTAKNADLVQLNRLKDEFLACISHELKTPLTAVLGLSSLLKDQTLGTLNERQTRYARLINHSGRQLMAVVNDILDLTRMETGQLELTLEPVQIQSVCDRAYSQAQQRPSEKNQQEDATTEDDEDQIHFNLEIEPGLELLVADELRLRQMLMHLLSNALKFTDPGGEIGLRVNRWEGWIAFTVWDTGIGIPAEKQHLIFQKFQQLEKPLTRRYEGTGLGLVLTQRLARLHGGDISFLSNVGAGSQFTLLLPPIPPQESQTDDETPVASSPAVPPNAKFTSLTPKHNRLVLIVETVPQYLEDLTQQLNNLAYRVVIARSGTEAIEKARSLQPCAVLLNPLLPQLSGWDVLTLLKSDAQTSHIPAIVTATQAEKQQAYHHQADGFLSLPVQEQALLQSLTSLGDRELAPKKCNLTILHLSPMLDNSVPRSSLLSCELTAILNQQNPELNYRILEADDLDQAGLLSKVWHPDVILLDCEQVADPFAYLAQFASYPNLTTLPLVTLDHQTTEAANQIAGLIVYPCLASNQACKVEPLLEVLQVAAGMNRKPSILVMEIKSDQNAVNETRESDQVHSDNSWRQAMLQYLETAGFITIISGSWTELHRQIKEQSVDLLLLRLKDTDDPAALIGLNSLEPLPKPPIIVLDQRVAAVTNHQSQLASELESILARLATKILPSQSMSQLLQQINQTLTGQ
jgi:signal transduction histidine kinase/CheY-like chemotaxis protein